MQGISRSGAKDFGDIASVPVRGIGKAGLRGYHPRETEIQIYVSALVNALSVLDLTVQREFQIP